VEDGFTVLLSPGACSELPPVPEVLKRWVAIRETLDGRVIVGHISCTDLAQDGRAVWDQLFNRIRQVHLDVEKNQYLMLQELYVREDERNAGIARMLIRHALWTIEEQILPQRRKEAGEGAPRPLQRIGLTVVRHPGFKDMMESIYLADGVTMLLGKSDGACSEIRFGPSQRTIHLCVLGYGILE
jgi:GNAT superfamily N-acetyltransferase